MREINETWEADISALVDGELDHPKLLETVDRIVAGESCREFYRRARRFDALLAEVRGEAPAELWTAIATAAERRGRRTRRTWLAAAAVVVVGAVLALMWPNAGTTRAIDPAVVEVQVAGSADGGMGDARFVELTAELLRADRRYHRAMEEILDAVDRHAANEGGGTEEERSPQGELLLAVDAGEPRWD